MWDGVQVLVYAYAKANVRILQKHMPKLSKNTEKVSYW